MWSKKIYYIAPPEKNFLVRAVCTTQLKTNPSPCLQATLEMTPSSVLKHVLVFSHAIQPPLSYKIFHLSSRKG